MDRYLYRDPFLAQDSRAGGEGKELAAIKCFRMEHLGHW